MCEFCNNNIHRKVFRKEKIRNFPGKILPETFSPNVKMNQEKNDEKKEDN